MSVVMNERNRGRIIVFIISKDHKYRTHPTLFLSCWTVELKSVKMNYSHSHIHCGSG